MANKALETAGNILTAFDRVLGTAGSSTVQYSLEKAPKKDIWNFLLGAQHQCNKHFILRAKYVFLGSRIFI